MRAPLLLFALFLLVTGCTPASSDLPVPSAHPAAVSVPAPTLPDPFGDYWYQGVAELTSYDLEQARYGELHPGHAVLIFVTEDFDPEAHVKHDDWRTPGAVKVLKMNQTRVFTTGIYPYTMMTSVFTPVDRAAHPHTFKVTTSSQEWCGHTFTQLNRTDAGYRAQLFSYFEGEGDRDLQLDTALLEDALWNRIRLGPDALPTGALRLLPGTIHQRLSHREIRPYEATATLEAQGTQHVYTLTYPDLDRTLAIRFNTAFPHEIEGWTETHLSGFGADAQRLTTKATRRARILDAYWSHNSLADAAYRDSLGL